LISIIVVTGSELYSIARLWLHDTRNFDIAKCIE